MVGIWQQVQLHLCTDALFPTPCLPLHWNHPGSLLAEQALGSLTSLSWSPWVWGPKIFFVHKAAQMTPIAWEPESPYKVSVQDRAGRGELPCTLGEIDFHRTQERVLGGSGLWAGSSRMIIGSHGGNGRESISGKRKTPSRVAETRTDTVRWGAGGQLWGAVCDLKLINLYWFPAMFWALCPRRVRLLENRVFLGLAPRLLFGWPEWCPITAKLWESPKNPASWGYKATFGGGSVSAGKAQNSGLCHRDHFFLMQPQRVR